MTSPQARMNSEAEFYPMYFAYEPVSAIRPTLLIDGLFGIGINRPLSADWVRFIERIKHTNAKILAVDVTSGLNGDTGEPQGAAIRATVTLTVGAPKAGMLAESA